MPDSARKAQGLRLVDLPFERLSLPGFLTTLPGRCPFSHGTGHDR
jgi:hypothetical protein